MSVPVIWAHDAGSCGPAMGISAPLGGCFVFFRHLPAWFGCLVGVGKSAGRGRDSDQKDGMAFA